jgi:hypothetical protein
VKIIDGFHDAELTGISSGDSPRSIVLLFSLMNEQKRSLALRDCKIFRASDFVIQNVVSRLLLFHGPEIDTDSVAERLRWASSLSDASSSLSHERQSELIEKIRTGDLSLLVLEPSCGAELVALFGEMSG